MFTTFSLSTEQIINFALLIVDDGYTLKDIFKVFKFDETQISLTDFKNYLIKKIKELNDNELYSALNSALKNNNKKVSHLTLKTEYFLSDNELIGIAFLIIENGYSLRSIESLFSSEKKRISKSTLHKLLHQRIPLLDMDLYIVLKDALKENFDTKHIRGGISTKKKYLS